MKTPLSVKVCCFHHDFCFIALFDVSSPNICGKKIHCSNHCASMLPKINHKHTCLQKLHKVMAKAVTGPSLETFQMPHVSLPLSHSVALSQHHKDCHSVAQEKLWLETELRQLPTKADYILSPCRQVTFYFPSSCIPLAQVPL